VIVRFPGGKRVTAESKGYCIETDQSEAHGGTGAAPSPFDLFLASLATCSGYYVLAFCEKRGIPTEDISLTVSTTRDESGKHVDRIEVAVRLPDVFPDKYIAACVAAAGQCAVKRHLADPPEVVLTAAKA